MLLLNHRSVDKTCAMRVSSMPNAVVDDILARRFTPEVLFTFATLNDGDPDFLSWGFKREPSPSLIREAFELAISIHTSDDWFIKAKMMVDKLHPMKMNRVEALEEIDKWTMLLSVGDEDTICRRTVERARAASESYREGLLICLE